MFETLAVFYDVMEAQLCRAFLESRQVHAFLADEHINTINPLYSFAVGGIKLNVPASQWEEAKKLYEEFQSGVAQEPTNPICPNCASDKTLQLPHEKNAYYNEFRCFDCDHLWDDKYLHNINPGHIE